MVETRAAADVGRVAGMQFAWVALSHEGKIRTLNEDRFLAQPGLFAVADGMGGHEAGEVASQLAIDELARLVKTLPVPASQLNRLASAVNGRVHEHALERGQRGMGTTLTGLIAIDVGGSPALAVVSVGDSRCYRQRQCGPLELLSRDHSVVAELLAEGTLTDAEARVHPERHVLTQAIGVEPSVLADYHLFGVNEPTRLLLCSDGVWGMLPHEVLSLSMTANADIEVAARSVLDEVLCGDAPDNATIVVIDVQPVVPPARNSDLDDTKPGPDYVHGDEQRS